MSHSKEMIDKIKDHKKSQKENLKGYSEHPKTCAILLSFNHVYNVDDLYEGLIESGFDEIIICEDGSIDGSFEAWRDKIKEKNHYILRSNDIHELRAYDKAIKMSDAEIFCLLQDDDMIPKNDDWVKEALEYFEDDPDLGILGGARGRRATFTKTWGIGKPGTTKPLEYIHPKTNKPFMYIENINIGPYFMKKDLYLQIGGFDKACSKAGEPGILFESEICYRAWEAGYHVALCDQPIKDTDDERGTIIFNEIDPGKASLFERTKGQKGGIRQRNSERNINFIKKTYARYSHQELQPKIKKLASKFNLKSRKKK
tara:strand:+ start:4615 stop:5556 length:942 start_codon:yes stop_codon:yes gene_type:complete